LLAKLGLYRLVRSAYQRACNRPWFARRQALREKFRPYVEPGGLVFDIGAHRGEYADVFADLGARVVAVEPNPRLAELIRSRYGRRLTDVVCTAVGSTSRDGELHVGSDDQHSTLSLEWKAVAPERDWPHRVVVPVTTLDALIDEYGEPGFIKIDVEGYEADVLAGLSRPVRALVFEFQQALPDVRRACLRRLRELGSYETYVDDAGGETGDIFAQLTKEH
jgi:FkbM family methyltransferase